MSVSRTFFEIFIVIEWRELEIWVRVVSFEKLGAVPVRIPQLTTG